MSRLLIIALVAGVVLPGQVLADRADTGNTNQEEAPVAAGQVDLTKPAQVITNYQQTGAPQAPEATAPQAEPEAQQIVDEPQVIKKKSAASKRKRSSSVAGRTRQKRARETWFDNEGTRLVQTLRDCITKYAAELDGPRTSYAMRQIISSAIDTVCRTDFDQMAEQVARRLGEDRFKEISAEFVSDLLASSLRQDQPVDQAATDG